MAKIGSEDLIGTRFENMADFLRRRRTYKDNHSNLTDEQLEQKYPKSTCLFKNCEAKFSLLSSLISHLNAFHSGYCDKLM